MMRSKQGVFYTIIFFFIVLFLFESNTLSAQKDTLKVEDTTKKKKMSFRDSTDGAIDLSSVLLDHNGFLPIPFIITEPAVGYGGGLGLLFFHKQKKKYDRWVPPNITGVAGLGTENGTWLAGFLHFHVFGADRVRYIGAIAKPFVNINYYGNNNEFLSKNPVKLNMNAWLMIQRVQIRIAETNLFIGGSYVYFSTENTLDTFAEKPLLNKVLQNFSGRSIISTIQPNFNWDTRDNIFSPTKGVLTGLTFNYSATWIGSDDDFYKFNTYFMGYLPISQRVFSGWRFDGNYMLGDAPFYALPFVQLRGVPMMRYQSNNTMLVETEWRFATKKRWSFDVFGGTGKAFPTFDEFASSEWVIGYGVGFRYEIAKAFGLLTGIDFAWDKNGDFAFYITFGSAWGK